MVKKAYRDGETNAEHVCERRAKKGTTSRIDTDLYWALKELAARNRRSVGEELDQAVRAHLAAGLGKEP